MLFHKLRYRFAHKLIRLAINKKYDNRYILSIVIFLFNLLSSSIYAVKHKKSNHHYVPQFIIKNFKIVSLHVLCTIELLNCFLNFHKKLLCQSFESFIIWQRWHATVSWRSLRRDSSCWNVTTWRSWEHQNSTIVKVRLLFCYKRLNMPLTTGRRIQTDHNPARCWIPEDLTTSHLGY